MTARSSPPQPTLRQLRQARGWSQAELAELLGASTSAVATWEQGRKRPRVRMLLRMARLFEVGVDEIVFGQARDDHD